MEDNFITMSRFRYIKDIFTPDLGLGKGANYTEIEDGWAVRQVDIFEDYNRWLCSGCLDDYDEELQLGSGMLCDQPFVIDDYEIQVIGEDFFQRKYGIEWREQLTEMFIGMQEISKDEFEEIWNEAIRRCLERFPNTDLNKKLETKYETLE